MKTKFTVADVLTLSWQDVTSVRAANGHYRVEITWSLDRYRIRVYRRVQEPEAFVRQHYAWYGRTAVATANKMLRRYQERD